MQSTTQGSCDCSYRSKYKDCYDIYKKIDSDLRDWWELSVLLTNAFCLVYRLEETTAIATLLACRRLSVVLIVLLASWVWPTVMVASWRQVLFPSGGVEAASEVCLALVVATRTHPIAHGIVALTLESLSLESLTLEALVLEAARAHAHALLLPWSVGWWWSVVAMLWGRHGCKRS